MSNVINNLKELKDKVQIPEGETPAENPVDPVPEQKLGLVDRAYASYKESQQKALDKKAAKEAAKAEKKAAKEAKKAEKKPDKYLGGKILAGVVVGGALVGAAAKLVLGGHTTGDQTCACEETDQEIGEETCTEEPDVPSEE